MKTQAYFKLTNGLWICYILTVCFLVMFCRAIHFSSIDYFQGAANWLAGKPLYTATNLTFLYFPQTAIFYAALMKIPSMLYEIVWRILTLSLLWYGIYRFSRLNQSGNYQYFFFTSSIITMLLGLSAALTGQLGLIVVDGMLLAAVEILDERWWFAAFYLIVGLSLNPAMLIMFLLTRAVYRRLFYSALILFLISFIIPFLLQNAHNFWQQYAEIHKVIRPTNVANLHWSQLFNIIGHLGIIIPAHLQTAITFITGIIIFVYCIRIKNKFARPQFCVFLFFIAAVFLMLFNPHTVLSDYIILAPAIGFFFSVAYQEKIVWFATVLVVIILAICTQMLLGFFYDPVKFSWLAPLMAVIFFITGLIKLPLLYYRNTSFVLS